ncbi:DUF6894 family protein [Methylorubrum extorquens]|uniref:DUF6894 family protein n=1 Tax=Methylorubrum extorquens TaxID=408 RepID=UPI001EE52910|nr:hypothetical protein [Methylorubrum extorquens]MCG5249466.1 hypothetical protein [Methylorubrum extorquens]
MPRYFFDIDDGVRDVHDDEGVTFNDQESARKEAIVTLAELAKDILLDGNDHVFKAQVRDETGKRIYEAALTLRSAWDP